MKSKILLFTILTFLLITPITVFAATIEILPTCATSGNGDFCCALLVAQRIAEWILGIIGSFALLYFIYGGFLWITSAGRSERVKQGKGIVINTILGIFIVIIAWFAVNFIITSLAGSPNIAGGTAWYEICENK